MSKIKEVSSRLKSNPSAIALGIGIKLKANQSQSSKDDSSQSEIGGSDATPTGSMSKLRNKLMGNAQARLMGMTIQSKYIIVSALESCTSLRTDGDFCHQGRAEHRNCPKHLRLSKHTDMTIHWNYRAFQNNCPCKAPED
jgi:hypothetical protein